MNSFNPAIIAGSSPAASGAVGGGFLSGVSGAVGGAFDSLTSGVGSLFGGGGAGAALGGITGGMGLPSITGGHASSDTGDANVGGAQFGAFNYAPGMSSLQVAGIVAATALLVFLVVKK